MRMQLIHAKKCSQLVYVYVDFFLEAGFQNDDIEAIDMASVFKVSKWASLRSSTW